jgi:hypothetical protein
MSKNKEHFERRYGGAHEEPDFVPRKMSLTLSENLVEQIEAWMHARKLLNTSMAVRTLLRDGLATYRGGRGVPAPGKNRDEFTVAPVLPLAETLRLVAEKLGTTPEALIVALVTRHIGEAVEEAEKASRASQEALERAKRLSGPAPTSDPTAGTPGALEARGE